jgi:pimeloyl-ACP methyl ester carboxylesterase
VATLTLLSNPAAIERHVVFVHGVRFPMTTTAWLSSGEKPEVWPRWLAEDIPGLAVWTIEHDSAPSLWQGHAMARIDRANNILPLLLHEKRLAQGDIAFVAHSFGGLIVQELLRIANDRSTGEPDVADFVRRVSRITFLGTPHRGVDLATWAGILRLRVRPSSAAQGLRRNDPDLLGLNQWFRRYAPENGITIRILTETRKTRGVLIVAPDSADPGLASDPIPLDADHFGIAAPASRQSEAYIHIKHFLSTPPAARGRRRLVEDDALQGITAGTAANAAALERIENTLRGDALTAAPPTGIPRELLDVEVDRRLTHLRKSRFFVGANGSLHA